MLRFGGGWLASPGHGLTALVGWLWDRSAFKLLPPDWAWCLVLLVFARREVNRIVANLLGNWLLCLLSRLATWWCGSQLLAQQGLLLNFLGKCGFNDCSLLSLNWGKLASYEPEASAS